MKHSITHDGTFPLLRVDLNPNESIKAESNAMVAMSPSIELKGTVDGGLFKGLGRMLAGESFFFQELTAKNGPGYALLAPSSIGDIESIDLDGSYRLLVAKNGFLAGTSGLNVSTKMQNLTKGIFSGEGFFVVEVSGKGTAFISALGAIDVINLKEGEEVIIDNGHLVAWPDHIKYKIEKASKGWISSITSGEALVCRFTGPGAVLIQSRNPKGFGDWVNQFIPKKP